MTDKILSLIDQYWDIAYQQGVEGRTTDNEAGDAQRVLSEITAALALVPGEIVLHGPYGYLNGNRALSEDEWTLDNNPGENSDEYFSIPLFSKVDAFCPTPHPSLDREGLLEEAEHKEWEARARRADADNIRLAQERGIYEEILRCVCGHLELPQSESGPADDITLYDCALEQADVMYHQTEAERVEHKNARYKAEAQLFQAVKVMGDILPMAEDKWANPQEVAEIVAARVFLSKLGASSNAV